ncbi:MAG: hypothetical protein IKO19_07025 [Candidatus Riflebacteria bacterium]|nr:hypothetical protein [Candidatus Riflebacteria bacterium]MBR4570400.1 hypothetical protein [Candidatus Riflebacteria bacterium]
MKKKTYKWFVLLFALCFGCFLTGCRQGPSKEPPRYYERELARMKKEEAKKAAEKTEYQFMSDRYPWRGTKSESHLHCVPCRITIEDRCLSSRIEYLTEVVHGKRKCRIKFRD